MVSHSYRSQLETRVPNLHSAGRWRGKCMPKSNHEDVTGNWN